MKQMSIAAAFCSAFVLAGGTPLVNLETYDVSRIVPVDFTAPLWVTPKPVKTDGIKVEKVKTENGFALDVRITDDTLLNPGLRRKGSFTGISRVISISVRISKTWMTISR